MTCVPVCPVDDIDPEDVRRFVHGGTTYAVCRDDEGRVFAVAGLCTHEHVDLCDGFVFGCVIECPRHNGRFRLDTGAPGGGPVTEALATFDVRVEDGMIFLRVEG